MICITTDGKAREVQVNGCLTGLELAAVILTKDDDKPELNDYLKEVVFPRMTHATTAIEIPKDEQKSERVL